MPILNNIFTRIWKFVDHRAAGDDVTRADLDVALDDLAGGINGVIDVARGALNTATTANTKATDALQETTELRAAVEALDPEVNTAQLLTKDGNLSGLASRSVSVKNLFGLAQLLAAYPLHYPRVRATGDGMEMRSISDLATDIGIATDLNGFSARLEALEVFMNAETAIGEALRISTDQTGARASIGAAAQTAAFGQDQVWRSFTVGTQRIVATSYQNTTGRPIHVCIEGDGTADADVQVSADNSTWIKVGRLLNGSRETVSFPVPNTGFYRVASGGTPANWVEFRHPTN